MKFSRKSKKIKRSSNQSRTKLSNRDLSIKINEVKNSKKKFRLSYIKNLTWHKKNGAATIKLPLMTPVLSPYIEDLQDEFMFVLKKLNNTFLNQKIQQREEHSNLVEEEECKQYQTKFYAKKRLLITRSIDDFARISNKRYPYSSSFSSQFVHQSLLKTMARRTNHSNISLTNTNFPVKISLESINNKTTSLSSNQSIKSESCLKKQNSSINRPLSLHWDENSLKSTSKYYQSHDAAIIDIEQQSYLSFNKSLEKSHSSPLPMNTNHSSIDNNPIQSAHIIDQYTYENKNTISLYSCISEVGNNQSTESSNSDEESTKNSLFQYNRKNLRHRWSLLDIWKTTMAKLPPVFNHIWRKRLRRTGSKEFLLEYDQILSTNNNNNHQANFGQEQRYVEQERPIHSYIGLALFALLIFPPVGILAFILSIWSLCGQQDRHLSRKFGNAVYWISMLSICLSFLLLLTLLTYFTYQYLISYSSNTLSNNKRN